MTITTLKYIHKLLVEEERRTCNLYRGARDLLSDYKETGADKAKIDNMKISCEALEKDHLDAVWALNDFENQEW